jgi:DNA-binding response OmpR family regulator
MWSNSREHKNKICACCGQDIVIPNEFTSMNVKSSARLVLFQLFRAMPDTIRYEQFSSARESLWVTISRLREALEDQGSPYTIKVDRGIGYHLIHKAQRSAA